MSELETTLDGVRRGELTLEQPRVGFRFNVDALILADFAATRASAPPAEVVDLGAGVGVVGLLLARRFADARVRLVEIQPELAQLAVANAARNGLAARVEVCCADLVDVARWAPAGRAGARVLLVSNPPFFRIGSGRVSASRQLCLAKHEVACTLQELLDAIARALPGGEGEAALIFTADREAELAAGLAARGLTTLARRWVIPLPGRPATRCLVLAASSRSEAVGAQACAEEPPLVVELEPGRFSPELEGILGEKPAEQEDTRCQTS